MSRGINKSRLEKAKQINVKNYLLDKHPDMFRYGKNNATLILKSNSDYVIYDDHAFNFADNISFPRRDNIDILQDLFDFEFIQAVEELEMWSEQSSDANAKSEVRLDLFNSIDDTPTPDDGAQIPFFLQKDEPPFIG